MRVSHSCHPGTVLNEYCVGRSGANNPNTGRGVVEPFDGCHQIAEHHSVKLHHFGLGDLCAILFMLSDRDYERTLSLVFTARGFAPDSVERILKTEEWLMSLTCPARDELFALEATTRIWPTRNGFGNW